MKVLLVSSSILPQTGGSSIIVENLARNFRPDEMIVFGSRGFNQKTYLERSQDGVQFKYFFTELSLFGRGARFFDWFRRLRFKPLVEEIKRVISVDEIDIVLGVYPNSFYCLAASRAAAALNIPFYSYFHNTYTDNIAINNPEAEHYQKEIFDNSKKIFVMSEGMKNFYDEKYRLQKFAPLVHTFENYPEKASYSELPGAEKEVYELVAIGNFNESNLDATKRLLQAIKNTKFELSIYTHVPKLLLQKRGLNTRNFKYMGAVNPDQIHEELQKYDICVLTHGFEGGYGEVEYKTIFPTRTIPFLLSGKPILAHSPKGSFLNSFIKENKCAELIDEANISEITMGLERIANDAKYQKDLVTFAMNAASQFHSPGVVNRFMEILTDSQKEQS